MKSFLSCSLLLLSLAAVAHADTVSYSTAFGSSIAPVSLSSFPLSLTLPKFDLALGNLTGVSLTLTSTSSTAISQVLNFSPISQDYIGAKATLNIGVTAPDGTALAVHATAGPFSGTAAAGPFVLTVAGSATIGAVADTESATNFLPYEGVGNSSFDVSGTAFVTGAALNAGSLGFGGDGTTYGNVAVTYTFTPVPEPSLYASLLGGFALVAALRRRARFSFCLN